LASVGRGAGASLTSAAVLGQDSGAVVLRVALAVAGDGQFSESGNRAVRLADGNDGVQDVTRFSAAATAARTRA
jgi:hypothetical protein